MGDGRPEIGDWRREVGREASWLEDRRRPLVQFHLVLRLRELGVAVQLGTTRRREPAAVAERL